MPTERDLAALDVVARLQPVTIAQVARVTGRAYGDARDTLERLCAARWAEVLNARLGLPVSRPNVYRTTVRGASLLGLDVRPWQGTSPEHLPHELLVRDAVAWAFAAARAHGLDPPKVRVRGLNLGPVTPDALVDLTVRRATPESPAARLVGLLEVDRGTERGTRRWAQKAAGYRALLAGGDLPGALAGTRPRVLVLAPDARRLSAIAAAVGGADPAVLGRCWLTTVAALETPDLTAPLWTYGGTVGPLVSP